MLKLCYVSQEVYTFENQVELIKTLNFDHFQLAKLDVLNNSITFTINHDRYIRLRDLIFWIESDFVRIHLGQLLHLILSLLEKVEQLEKQGIKHNYLDFNRIWLYFTETSQYPSLIYQYLDYSIHFTGYQCPLNDQNMHSQTDSIKIKEIIVSIIDQCYKRIHLKQNNQEMKNKIYKDIILPLIDLCKSIQSINVIIQYIQQILKKYNYQEDRNNNLVQSLKIDDNNNDYIKSDRYKLIQKVQKDLKQIIEIGNNYGYLIIEYLLQYTIPIISQNLKSYSLPNYKEIALDQFNLLKNRELELNEILEQYVKDLIKYSLKEYSKEYKFDIDEQEMNSLEYDIIISILTSSQVRHFYNTHWFQQNQQINDFIFAAISKIIRKEVNYNLEVFFIYKILILIDELI